MENSWSLLLAFACCLAALAFISSKLHKPRRKLAPGPKPWPIIGHLHLIGSVPHQTFHLLSQKYGELMQLRFGNFPVIVASSPEMAKQFLKTHDTVFASRPPLAAGKIIKYNFSDMTWAPYGPYWRLARKIFSSEVLNQRALESHEHIRIDERRGFLSRLREISILGKPIVLRDHLLRCNLSTISRILFGKIYLSMDSLEHVESKMIRLEEFQEMLDDWFWLNGVFDVGDWIPWLKFLDLHGYVKKMKVLSDKLDVFYDRVINDHVSRKAMEKDTVDSLLEMAEDPNLEVKLTMDCIKALLQDLLAAGRDTSTTVEWAIHEILRQPHIYEKAKQELDRVIGRNRWVEENDSSELPYLDAIIKETMRLHPISPFLAPHYSTEDCDVAGYHIPKGTTVLVNTWSIGRDPESWNMPDEFDPERFLGKEEIDVLGSNFAMLPFGSGRRKCPGYNLGLKLVRSLLGNLLHGFDWKLAEGMKPEDVCMDELYGFTTRPNVPIVIILEPTLPVHLY